MHHAMRLRNLLWLVAMTAFLLPSFVGSPAASDRMMMHPVMSDCGHDAPPPPCPEKDTARHAAGLCCPFMSGLGELLPPVATVGTRGVHASYTVPAARHLTGLSPHEDPPPPRV
jgi:hypothetical protein